MISNRERRIRHAAAHILLFVLAAVTACSAQEERRAIQKPTPTNPALARQLRLPGTVKIKAVITPDGQVKQAEVVGAHPLLVGPDELGLDAFRAVVPRVVYSSRWVAFFRLDGNRDLPLAAAA